jgi:hypothetical protein
MHVLKRADGPRITVVFHSLRQESFEKAYAYMPCINMQAIPDHKDSGSLGLKHNLP